jgi:hypothetical protein
LPAATETGFQEHAPPLGAFSIAPLLKNGGFVDNGRAASF